MLIASFKAILDHQFLILQHITTAPNGFCVIAITRHLMEFLIKSADKHNDNLKLKIIYASTRLVKKHL